MDEKELLRTVPIFSELTDDDIVSLARLSIRKHYAKDAVVFFENEEGDFFFMILDGRIKVTILGDDGREVILSLLGPGDFFGEMALLDVYGRVARVIVDMAREEGRRLKDGRIAFRRATHQEIANRIGTTRETVTRMLKDLERQGLIHVEGKELVVQPDFEKVFD